LVDRKVAAVEIDSVAVFQFPAAVAGKVKSPDQGKPEHGSTEDCAGQARTADQVEHSEPEAPVEHPYGDGIYGVCNGAPFFIMGIGIQFYSSMFHEVNGFVVSRFA